MRRLLSTLALQRGDLPDASYIVHDGAVFRSGTPRELFTGPYQYCLPGRREYDVSAEAGAPCTNGPCGAAGEPPYGWSISRSATDPHVNTGELHGICTLHLWLTCDVNDGIGAAELELGGNFAVMDYVPVVGANEGSTTDLRLVLPGCPSGPTRIGEIVVLTDPTATEPSSWGRLRSWYR